MAKKKVNKSQAIRDYVTANPSASAKAVVAALARKRIKVTPATVATVKSKAGLTKSRRKTSKARRVVKSGAESQFIDILIEAKKFHAKAGSTEAALEAIRAIDRLDSIS